MDEVYIVWKDYGGGDYTLIAVCASPAGAAQRVLQSFYEAKSNNFNPYWNDGRLHEEDHESFHADTYEVTTQRVPLVP